MDIPIQRIKDSVRIGDASYRIEIEEAEEGGYVGQCTSPQSFTGAISQGETLTECRDNLVETIRRMSEFVAGYRIK